MSLQEEQTTHCFLQSVPQYTKEMRICLHLGRKALPACAPHLGRKALPACTPHLGRKALAGCPAPEGDATPHRHHHFMCVTLGPSSTAFLSSSVLQGPRGHLNKQLCSWAAEERPETQTLPEAQDTLCYILIDF